MTEAEFLEGYDPGVHERPSVAVDLILMSVVGGRPAALLLRRDEHPHLGRWALPGGFVAIDESLDAAARRVLGAKARMTDAYVEQLYTFGAVDRDPRTRIVSVAYFALLPAARFAAALKGAPELTLAELVVPWPGETGGPVEARSADGDALPLAFDHAEMLGLAMLRLRGKLDYSGVAFALLPELFTLRALQDVHEAILGVRLNKPAFRRRMLDTGRLEATGERETGASFRPAELFRCRKTMPEQE
ncbi:8-oxo-dGTP diphosphatase [Methylopila capsulata]|uniref:8-oxo-dGTP diphosphatase n=1 Tax=Methylopila capsulata TaxID=61654 RepID=A0A9W6IYT5_9HYPH|nr:NUDIX domain-containing protein [Methylopila capsulata]MBM7853141.1 8-oxo-dGTP diphosphatase [Methylopila capsulata]GLK57645.1 NUDIX hydrolase [Methylopila capsulata]